MLIKSNIQDVLTNLVITNWGKGVLQIGAAFLLQIGANAYYKLRQLFYYKLGQSLLQIRAGITNWGNVYCKLGQVLQIGAKFITNWGRYYKLEQIITNWGTTESSIDAILTIRPRSFQNTSTYETGLSDYHHMITTFL